MQTLRITIPLSEPEYDALVKMAQEDYRHPRGQMRFLLCEEARRRKLLEIVTQHDRVDLDEALHEHPTSK